MTEKSEKNDKNSKAAHPGVGDFKVGDIMTSHVHTLQPSMTVRSAINLLLNNKVSGAPLVDPQGRVLSVVSESDLIKFAAMGQLDTELVALQSKLVAASKVIAVRKGDSFREVFKQFLTKPVRRVIVVDDMGKLQGIVSRSNLLRAFLKGGMG